MTQSAVMTEVSGKPGRPYIGPKAQTHIWPWIDQHARDVADERGIPRSDVYREMLEEAYAARLARGEA